MQSVMYTITFASSAGTCIVAELPRCLPSTMRNATPMTATLSSEEHVVLFSATSCEGAFILQSEAKLTGHISNASFATWPIYGHVNLSKRAY